MYISSDEDAEIKYSSKTVRGTE